MSIELLHKEIDRNWDKHLSETRRILRTPSVSMTGEGIQDTADNFEGLLRRLGAKTKQFKGMKESHPLVYGRLDVGAKDTCIIYGMYDVMPVGDLKEWEHPPFGATIVKKKPFGEILVNRGAINSKASLVGTVMAVETMLKKDALPVNLHFLLDGEEECGGQSLPRFVLKNKKALSDASAAFWFDYCESLKGVPIIPLGMKGCVYFDLIVEGKDRGGPESELHSSGAVLVESPVWRLVQAISTMVDEKQNPTVEGIWDDVRGPDRDDIKLTKELTKRILLKDVLREFEVKRFKEDLPAERLFLKYMFEPSINIDGLSAGFEEEGSKTVLPPRAMAKIDIRLVPDMTIEGTMKKVRNHLKRRGFADIRIREYEAYPCSRVPLNTRVVQASLEALRYHGKDPEVWPMSAGSAPTYVFDQILGIPHCGTGLGSGGKGHSPNEFAVVSKMRDFEKSAITTLWKYAELGDKPR